MGQLAHPATAIFACNCQPGPIPTKVYYRSSKP